VDCAGQRYWYFAVSPEGEAFWGFPGEEERRLLATARAAAKAATARWPAERP
jgi:hypothetical protein